MGNELIVEMKVKRECVYALSDAPLQTIKLYDAIHSILRFFSIV